MRNFLPGVFVYQYEKYHLAKNNRGGRGHAAKEIPLFSKGSFSRTRSDAPYNDFFDGKPGW
jgi:hypothetical protein